jgi:RHS repeat-associated protein
VGRLLRTTEPGDTSSTILTYTDDGLVSRQTLPDGTYTDYTYDAAHNQTGVTRSDGGSRSAVFDLGGRTTSATDENNLATTFTYDCLSRQLSASAGGASASTTTYNTLGWTLTRTDADGIATTTVYDTAGRTLQEATAGQATTSTYDPAGYLTRQVDPNDKWITFWYDLFGRENREWHTLPGDPRVTVKDTSLHYDGLSRVQSTTDNVTRITHAQSYPLNTPGPTTDILAVGGFFDAVQSTITVGADSLESTRLSTVISNPQLPNVLRTVTGRDEGLRVTGATLAAGQPTNNLANYLYDGAGRLQRQWGTAGGGSGFASDAQTTNAYTYNATSGRKSADNLRLSPVGMAGPLVASYTYTDDGRLDAATVDGVTEDDTFDAAGNLTAFTKGGVQTTLSYDAQNRLQTSLTGGITTYYSFDTTNGRRTSQGLSPSENDPGHIRFTYTGTGRLASYANPGTGVTATYSYDAQGQRTQSVGTQNGQTTTTAFTYEGLSLLRLTATQTGGESPTSWQLTYLYDEYGKPYAGVYRSPATAETATVFGMVTSDRGDILALTDAAGAPFAAYRYDAWGNPQGTGNLGTGVWTQTSSLIDATLAAAIASRQPLRYAGYSYDQESGLFYLSARTYDPSTRQFVSKDPAKADGEESAYQYCAGDPVDKTDPSGSYYGNNKIFNFKHEKQEYDQWCWVAAGQAIVNTRRNVNRGQKGYVYQMSFSWYSHYNYLNVGGNVNDVDRGLDHYGLEAQAYEGTKTVKWLAQKMVENSPVAIRVAWDWGGGHFLVVWAVDRDSSKLKVWDPWDNTTNNEWTYSQLKRNTTRGWTWTHTVYATR